MRKATKARKQGPVMVEQLEERKLLSSTLDGDVLRILCGATSDTINITLEQNQLVVKENGQTSAFPVSAVAKIFWDGGEGADRFELQRDLYIPVEAWGGKGPDIIFTGIANDTIYAGMGADLIVTADGADLVRSGLGNDRVLAGGKADTIYGGEGNDIINTGAGIDTVYDESGTNAVDSGSAITLQPMGRTTFEPQAFLPSVRGYDPNQIRQAYNLGIGETQAQYWQRGAGQTIYIVNAFSGLNTLSDLAAFSGQFDLPLPTADNFQIVNEGGRTPAMDPGWAGEINLDVQWAHAIAPGAKIVLVQADTNIEPDLYRATRLAASMATADGGGVVSMSWGRGGGLDPTIPWDGLFNSFPNVSFVAASGDGVLSFPAGSPFVTAVGGTNLQLDREGNRISEETPWILGGSGVALAYERPTYQRDISLIDVYSQSPLIGRGVPDVSYNGDTDTPVAFYLTTPNGGNRGWFTGAGTSAGAPQWAALVAIINQKRDAIGLGAVGGGLNGMLYDMARFDVGGDDNTSPFYDVIVGATAGEVVDAAGVATPTVFPALIGYDLATGLGTPNGDNLIYWMSTTESFYMQDDFTFQAKMLVPTTDTSEFRTYYGQYRGGVGTIAGDDVLQLSFVTNKTDVLFDTDSLAFGDTYFNLNTDYPSTQFVYLYRSGRGQDSGAIYGTGDAIIINTDPQFSGASVPFKLKFEGTWWTTSSGDIDFKIEFYAVDPITWDRIEPSTVTAAVPYYEGEIRG